MSLAITVGGTPITFDEESYRLSNMQDEHRRCQFTVLDYAGTQNYVYGTQVIVTDPVLGRQFKGMVVTDILDKSNTYPDPTIEHKLDCVGVERVAFNRTSKRQYATPVYAGKVAIDMMGDTLAAEGVVANYAQRFETTQADFAQGTLSNVVATPNVGDGDLELGVIGTQVQEEFYYQNEWNTQGAFSNTLADTSSPDSYLLLNQYFKDWNDGSTAGQGVYGTGIISAGVVGGGVYQITAAPNGGDVTSYLGLPGAWGDFTMECDCFIGATSINSLSWRTTSFNNNSGSYAYALRFYTTGISLWRGTNGGATGGVQLTAATFGTALAANAYYRVKVVMTGANMYLYVNGIFYLSYGDSTWAAAGYFGLRNWNQTNTSNRTVYFANFGVAASLTGTYTSLLISINSVATVTSSVIVWDQGQTTDPADVTINVYTTIDGGVSYQVCSNGGTIAGLGAGAVGTGKNVGVYVTYTLANTKAIPRLRALAWGVAGGGYLPSGTRTTKTFDGKDTVHRVNVASGFGTSTDKNIWTQAGVGTTAVNANEAQISATTGNVLMQLGTNTLTDMEDYVRFQTSANGTYAGTLLRYVDANNWYAVFCTLNSITLYKMIAGVAYTLSTATPTLALSTWYRLRARITGTGAPENPAIISGKVWLDGSAEPSPWTLQFTDRLGQDTFTRANQAGWNPGSDGQNWTIKSGTMTLSISNNVGLITAHTDVAYDTIAYGTKTSINAELLCLIAASSTGDEIGVMCRQTAANTYYMAFLFAGTTLFIQKNVAGVVTTIASVAYSYTINTYHYIRFRVVGSTLSAKAWPANITEPAGFSVTATDTAITAAGQYGICTYAGNTADTCYYVTFYASDANILASGGYGLLGSGAGMAQFDNFIASPSPFLADVYGLDLTPVGRLGSSAVNWTALLPTSATTIGVAISVNGAPWQDMTSSNGGPIPGINGQPDPTIDGFSSDSSANYSSTFRTGGAVAAWTYDTANKRVVATGGVNAVFLNSIIIQADIDLYCDLDRADAGGIVWRYVDASNFYVLVVGDSLASVGTPNTAVLYKIAAGVATQLATASISFVRGTYHRFRVTMLVGAITATMDGTALFAYTDASPLAAGQVGLYTNGGSSRFYQLWIQPQGDDVTDITVYSRIQEASTDATKTPRFLDLTMMAFNANIGRGGLLPSADYRFVPLNEVLDDLVKQSNDYSWSIDTSGALLCRKRAVIPAPWILQSGTFDKPLSDIEADGTLSVENAGDQYRSRQNLTGVIGVGAFSNTFIGNAKATSFTLSYPIAPGTVPTGTLNLSPQVFALKGSTGAQWYYAPGDPVIAQDAAGTALVSTDSFVVPYQGTFTTSVTVDNLPAQAALKALTVDTTGIVEATEDVSARGMLLAAATAYANQLLARYAVTGRTITFKTYRNGLAAGQILSIFLPEYSINNGQFFITKTDSTLRTQPGNTQQYASTVVASELPVIGSWAKLLSAGLVK